MPCCAANIQQSGQLRAAATNTWKSTTSSAINKWTIQMQRQNYETNRNGGAQQVDAELHDCAAEF